MPKPRIFISHSEKNREPSDYTIRLLHYLGCIPVIAENMPRGSRTIPDIVNDSMESCDAVVVIASSDVEGPEKNPSQGVIFELGMLKSTEKFKGKYFIIKEDAVNFSPMVPESRYKFSKSDFGPIAEAIIIELTSMGLLKNYHEMKGSELKIHDLIETLAQLKELSDKNVFDNKEQFKYYVEKVIQEIVNRVMGGNP